MIKVNELIALMSVGLGLWLIAGMVALTVRCATVVSDAQFIVAMVVFGITELVIGLAVVFCSDYETINDYEGEEEV